MLVKMNTSVVEDFSALDEGRLYDLPESRARVLIRLGKAEAIGLPSGPSRKTAARNQG